MVRGRAGQCRRAVEDRPVGLRAPRARREVGGVQGRSGRGDGQHGMDGRDADADVAQVRGAAGGVRRGAAGQHRAAPARQVLGETRREDVVVPDGDTGRAVVPAGGDGRAGHRRGALEDPLDPVGELRKRLHSGGPQIEMGRRALGHDVGARAAVGDHAVHPVVREDVLTQRGDPW